MSKYETLQNMKAEVKAMKAEIAKLETAEPTVENLNRVKEIETKARMTAIAARQFARQYGMIA